MAQGKNWAVETGGGQSDTPQRDIHQGATQKRFEQYTNGKDKTHHSQPWAACMTSNIECPIVYYTYMVYSCMTVFMAQLLISSRLAPQRARGNELVYWPLHN